MSDINLVIEDEEELKLELSSAMPKVETEELTINLNELDFADTSSVDISSGDKYVSNVIINKDENLVSDNIAEGVEIEGVSGTLKPTNWDTSKLTYMGYMFSNSSMSSIDFTGFDTSNVTNMQYMFNQCTKLTSLDLSTFNTSNVTNMQRMFYYCTGLTSLDLSNFDTGNIAYMSYMFGLCSGLTTLDLSTFNTSNLMDMSYMFYYCTGLTSLNLSSFTGITSDGNSSYSCSINARNVYGMFSNCKALQELDISGLSWRGTNQNIFYNCTSLTTVYVKDENSKTACDTALANAGLSIESTIKE